MTPRQQKTRLPFKGEGGRKTAPLTLWRKALGDVAAVLVVVLLLWAFMTVFTGCPR